MRQSLALAIALYSLLGVSHPAPARAAGDPAAGKSQINADLMRMRDPFKRPKPVLADQGVVLTQLEQVPVSAFKMLGVVTGPDRVRAMLADSTGRTHFVAENMRIGTRKGHVLRITPERVVVRERIPNLLGVMENIDTVISLPGDKPSEQK